MAAILLGHRRCSIITMALCTVVNDTGMIEYRWYKSAGYVTDTAILCCRDVADILFGHRTRTIITMTFCTVIYPAGMIKDSVSETRGVMAYAAILSCGRMRRRRIISFS